MGKICNRLAVTNNQHSELFNTLLSIANNNEELADEYYAFFKSERFINDFGDYQDQYTNFDAANLKISEKRLDINHEPKLFLDKKYNSYYYKNKHHKKVYYPSSTRNLNVYYSSEAIDSISKILALDFLKPRIGDDFNDLNLNKEKGRLIDSIKNKLESKIKELKSGPSIIEKTKGGVLELTLPHLNEWVKNVEDYYKSINLNYVETTEQDDVDEDTSAPGHAYGLSSFEKNSKDNVTSNIKLRLSLLQHGTEVDYLFYEPILISFDEVNSSLQKTLTNSIALMKNGQQEDLFEIYKQEIHTLSLKKPYLKSLTAQLDNITDINLKSQFVRAFNLDKNNFIGTIYDITKDNIIVDVLNLSDVGSKTNMVKNNWTYSFIKTVSNSNLEIDEASITKINDIESAFKGFYGDKNSGFRKDVYKGTVNLERASDEIRNILNDLGINTTENGFNHYLDGLETSTADKDLRIENLSNLLSSVNYLFKSLKTITTKNYKDILNSQNEITNLAKAESFFISEGSDASIFSVGKSKWVYSNPSYLSNKVKEWNKDITYLDNHFNASEFNKGSHYMSTMLNTPSLVKNLTLNVFNSLQVKNDAVNASDGKTLSKNDALADSYNKILGYKKPGGKSYFNTPTPADKSTQYQIGIPNELMVETNASFDRDTNQVVINDSAYEILVSYIVSEHNRMRKVQKEIDSGTTTMIEHYHIGRKNGIKFQSIPELNHDNFKNLGFNFELYGESGEVLDIDLTVEAKAQIKEYIKDIVSKNIKVFYDTLFDKKLLSYNADGVIINKGIDSSIWSSYDSRFRPLKVASDIFINGLISQIEYSKMFSGDVAYYKNADDYKKRIPATYTDGLQLYTQSYDNPVDQNKENYFNIAVINNVVVKTPYYEELVKLVGEDIASKYSDINSTDAQAWITPERWKFLMVRLGKWSNVHDSIYDKFNNPNAEYTSTELKQVAQPLKGVYFEINNGVPVYLKYSQAVLVPNMVRNNKGLQTLVNKMKDADIQELITIDGVKVGAAKPVKTHTDEGIVLNNFELTPYQLKNSGWKLQQDLPIKTFKLTEVGSQIQKNIYAGLSSNLDKTFDVNDIEMSGSELIEYINNIVAQLSNKGKDRFTKEFDVDDNNKINNIDALTDTLLDELKTRGASKNVIQALESGITPYAIPGYQQKIQNVFASIVLKRLVKIKTNGGSFIQMSNYGLNKDEADNKGVIWTPWAKETTHEYEVIGEKNGRQIIRPAGMLISGSLIAKYIPNYKKYSTAQLFGTKENDYKDAMIDKRILDSIIGYRIPNQHLASNDALEVVGILPEEMGDTVIAYTGITTKTGSDFDIDKMYLMIPSIKAIRKDGDVSKLKYVEDEGLSLEDQSLAQLQNSLIQAYKAVILNENVIEDVMTPIDFDFIKDDILDLFPKDPIEAYDTFNINKDVDLKYEFMAGNAGIGQTANMLVDHNRGLMADIYLNDTDIGMGFKNDKGFTTFDTEYSEVLNEIKDPKLKSIKVAHSLSAIMNGYVDIAKDSYITRGNWTTQTANVGFMLIRAGVHPFKVNALLGQPIIREYVDFITNSESKIINETSNIKDKFKQEQIRKLLENDTSIITINGISLTKRKIYKLVDSKPTLNKLATIFKLKEADEEVLDLYKHLKSLDKLFEDTKSANASNLSLKDLRYNVKNPKSAKLQPEILNWFYELVDNSKKLVENINASKVDVNGYGKNIGSLIVTTNLINKLLNEKESGSFMGYASKLHYNNEPTILGAYTENSVNYIKDVMQANPLFFATANQSIINTFNDISKSITNENLMNPKLADKLEKDFYSYLLSGFEPLKTSQEEKEDLINNLPDRLMAYSKENENLFIKELDIKLGDDSIFYITMNNKKKTPEYQTELTNAWLDLIVENKKLGNDLIKYSYLTSGFKMNINQFYTYIPYQFFAEGHIDEYINETLFELSNSDISDKQFSTQFFSHNITDYQLVGKIHGSQLNKKGLSNPAGVILEPNENFKGVKEYYVYEVSSEVEGKIKKRTLLFKLLGYDKDNAAILKRVPVHGKKDSKGHRIVEWSFGNEITTKDNDILIQPTTENLLELENQIDERYNPDKTKEDDFENMSDLDENITQEVKELWAFHSKVILEKHSNVTIQDFADIVNKNDKEEVENWIKNCYE